MFGIIQRIFKEFLPYSYGIIPVFALFRTISFWQMKKLNQKTTILHEVGMMVLIIYMIDLFIRNQTPLMSFYKELDGKINLIPVNKIVDMFFAAYSKNALGYAIENILTKMVLFLPIGFIIPLLWRFKTELWTVFCGFLISFILQILRLTFIKECNVDDIILNTLGTLLGYCIYLALKMTMKGPLEWFRVFKSQDVKNQKLQKNVTL